MATPSTATSRAGAILPYTVTQQTSDSTNTSGPVVNLHYRFEGASEEMLQHLRELTLPTQGKPVFENLPPNFFYRVTTWSSLVTPPRYLSAVSPEAAPMESLPEAENKADKKPDDSFDLRAWYSSQLNLLEVAEKRMKIHAKYEPIEKALQLQRSKLYGAPENVQAKILRDLVQYEINYLRLQKGAELAALEDPDSKQQ
jgi:hypothetical protein